MKLLSSLFGRLSLVVIIVSILSSAALFAMTEWIVRSEFREQMARSVDTDIAGLADIYITGGGSELSQRISDRLALQSPDDKRYYLLASPSGRAIIGNLHSWPELSSENSEAGFFRLADGTQVYGRATQLNPDLKLLVGRDTLARSALLARIRTAFLVAGVLLVLIFSMIGHYATRRLRTRLDSMNDAFREIGSGNLAATIPVDWRGDELDQLSEHGNAMIERVASLISAHRDISDHTAHELRTPLMHLDNRLVTAIGQSTDPLHSEALGRARQDIRDIIAMLDSLLDIASSRAQIGDRSGLSECDISKIAAEITELFAESAEDLEIKFGTDIAPGVKMMANPAHIQRILSNLLDNALKYTPKGGEVELVLQPGPVITVRDNGPGVPENMREKIFERFVRIDTNGAQGHGLGLALSQALAERNGLIIVCRDAGPGALFEIKPEGSA
ncbi:sensor histidine kinase [Sphingorhabdus sp. 109]|jgi:signal transduction histidine kinase|uniref:sensor histidine kinase n=1 Tax=Sphingorhabdus sp. 109 TaxID=2653173 RepID=UPI0012EFEA3E|nr:HAMP domain-containing sensor histidine kinase [Sphingorhabdus sp. 109]VWX58418.1 Swarming motility regulation sensor protein RssA [Sphingorhabdus sp. 109]